VAHSLDKIAGAAGKGARLIVLPELCNSGYVFASRHEAFTLAEPVPNGPTTEAWLEAARRHGAVIVAGICERAGDALYNSAAILGPDGFAPIERCIYGAPRTCSSNPAISASPYGRPSSAEWRWRSATAALQCADILRQRSRLVLRLAEREEISRGITAHQSARSMARLLGRSP
jgi:hypothetical protein